MPTFPQHPEAAEYTSSPWTHPDTGIQWTSTLVAVGTYRWQEYIAPADTGGGASAWADLTDKATAPITTDNTALAAALGLLAPKASPTFTGTVTIPSGASISGYLTTAAAASTYQPIGNYAPSTGIAASAITGTAVVTADSRLSDARTPTAHTHAASEVTGTLPIANGGTGSTTAAAAAVAIVNGNPINPSTVSFGGGGTITGASGAVTLATSGATAFSFVTNGSNRLTINGSGHTSLAIGRRFYVGGDNEGGYAYGSGSAFIIGSGSDILTVASTGASVTGTLTTTGITTATGGIVLGTKTVGTLPTASSNTYLSFIITDALAPALSVTVSAGGSAKAAVRSNGTNWIVTEVL